MIKIDEKYFEDILHNSLKTSEGCNDLRARGLYISTPKIYKIYRQYNLNQYGVPDIIIVGFTGKNLQITVIELKVVSFDVSHLFQLGRYISGVKHVLKSYNLSNKHVEVKGVLIATEFNDNSDYTWLDQVLDDSIQVYSTKYELNGMFFKKELPFNGWQWTDFKNNFSVLPLIDMYKESLQNLEKEIAKDIEDDLPF
jgi:hypothetical protein